MQVKLIKLNWHTDLDMLYDDLGSGYIISNISQLANGSLYVDLYSVMDKQIITLYQLKGNWQCNILREGSWDVTDHSLLTFLTDLQRTIPPVADPYR